MNVILLARNPCLKFSFINKRIYPKYKPNLAKQLADIDADALIVTLNYSRADIAL